MVENLRQRLHCARRDDEAMAPHTGRNGHHVRLCQCKNRLVSAQRSGRDGQEEEGEGKSDAKGN